MAIEIAGYEINRNKLYSARLPHKWIVTGADPDYKAYVSRDTHKDTAIKFGIAVSDDRETDGFRLLVQVLGGANMHAEGTQLIIDGSSVRFPGITPKLKEIVGRALLERLKSDGMPLEELIVR